MCTVPLCVSLCLWMHNETVQVVMTLEFKDKWLEQFYEDDKRHRLIPG
ncbi:toxin, partial [Vibrio cholerae]|nr:toxin [Vibrio cholerae]